MENSLKWLIGFAGMLLIITITAAVRWNLSRKEKKSDEKAKADPETDVKASPKAGFKLSAPGGEWLWFGLSAAAVVAIFVSAMKSSGASAPVGNEGAPQQRPQPTFNVTDLTERHVVLGPVQREWVMMPQAVVLPVDMTGGEPESPVVYTGLNLALSEGAGVKALFPQGSYNFSTYLGDYSGWEEISSTYESISKHQSWTALFVKGEARRKPGSPFQVKAWVDTPKTPHLRIATYKIANPGERLEWGLLPDRNQYNWRLYVRFAAIGGENLPPEVLVALSGGAVVGGTSQRLSFGENYISSKEQETGGENLLILKAPQIPGGTRVEVIVLITPKS